MLNHKGESVDPVEDYDGTLYFILHDGWLMYGNKGVRLCNELKGTRVNFYYWEEKDSPLGIECVRMPAIYHRQIHEFMKAGGYADMSLHDYLNKINSRDK